MEALSVIIGKNMRGNSAGCSYFCRFSTDFGCCIIWPVVGRKRAQKDPTGSTIIFHYRIAHYEDFHFLHFLTPFKSIPDPGSGRVPIIPIIPIILAAAILPIILFGV